MDLSSDPTIALFDSEIPEDAERRAADTLIPPGKCLLTKSFLEDQEKIKNLKVRPDDVWVITYPKCGTTWTIEMVWLLLNDFDFEKSKKSKLWERSVFMEYTSLTGKKLDRDAISLVEKMPSPRLIKSHLPKYLLPSELFVVKPKIIYVCRNPKDVAISFYHHHIAFVKYFGSLEHFLEAFLEDKVMYGSFWEHVLEFWKLRKEPNILFCTYEDMKKDLSSIAKMAAEHLNRRIPDDVMDEFLNHLSFKSMKDNPSVNYKSILDTIGGKDFMRKGVAGDWKGTLTEDQISRFDDWSRTNIGDTDFPYYC